MMLDVVHHSPLMDQLPRPDCMTKVDLCLFGAPDRRPRQLHWWNVSARQVDHVCSYAANLCDFSRVRHRKSVLWSKQKPHNFCHWVVDNILAP